MKIALYAEQPPLSMATIRGQTDTNNADPNGRRCLFVGGNPGERGNFCAFVGSSDHDTGYHPRHRHACDQVRVMIAGEAEFGPGLRMTEGMVGYFPAGTYYGPYEGSIFIGPDIMVCQFEGAHKATYIPLNSNELREATKALSKTGELKHGVYTWIDDAGQKHNKDGYEAAVERVTGERLTYPKPRYAQPVIIDPRNFKWKKLALGVEVRELGTFSEGGVRLASIHIGAGASHKIAASPNQRATLLTVVRGSGQGGGSALAVRDGIQLNPLEEIEVSTQGGVEIFLLGLPLLD
jgi:hypothetical protein